MWQFYLVEKWELYHCKNVFLSIYFASGWVLRPSSMHEFHLRYILLAYSLSCICPLNNPFCDDAIWSNLGIFFVSTILTTILCMYHWQFRIYWKLFSAGKYVCQIMLHVNETFKISFTWHCCSGRVQISWCNVLN